MEIVEIIKDFGLPIAVLVVLAYWYAKKDKQHKEEREATDKLHREERDTQEKSHKDERERIINIVNQQFENSNKVTNNSTSALTELSTLIKTLKK